MLKENMVVYPSGRLRIDETPFELVERKGIGHPDTLCDMIAEGVSQAYARYCLERYGVILRHMVDKIAISGGGARVMFGGGEMQKPVRLYLNCRFTRSFGKESIPYLEIVREVVHQQFSQVLPLLNLDQWLVIVDNTHFSQGPGVVYEGDGTTRNERQFFFEVPQGEYAVFHGNSLRANDTSTTVGYSPLSATEKVVLLVERTLNSIEFKKTHPYVGTDIKVMAKRVQRRLELTVCIPFIAVYTNDAHFYAEKLALLKELIARMVSAEYSQFEVLVSLNTRDNPQKSDFYLTFTGSAIESGDEGVVGRGNRYNGVISFTRHMSMEACCGKNPVYHVGKLYTALSARMSEDIHTRTGLETYVYLTSQMGRSLSDPWSVCVEVCGVHEVTPAHQQMIEAIVEQHLSNIGETTALIVRGGIALY
jgi:S-adenosylmethionine synthetase